MAATNASADAAIDTADAAMPAGVQLQHGSAAGSDPAVAPPRNGHRKQGS